MRVQTEWQVRTRYIDRDPKSGREYLCVYVMDDGRPVFVCNTGVGTQRAETRMPCGCQEYGSRCQGDIVETLEAWTTRRQAAIARQQVAVHAGSPWSYPYRDEA